MEGGEGGIVPRKKIICVVCTHNMFTWSARRAHNMYT